jgi:hypothetical protein
MIIIICKIHLKADNNSICLYDIKMAYRKFYCFPSSVAIIVAVFVDVNPNAIISPPLLESIPDGKPGVTKSSFYLSFCNYYNTNTFWDSFSYEKCTIEIII